MKVSDVTKKIRELRKGGAEKVRVVIHDTQGLVQEVFEFSVMEVGGRCMLRKDGSMSTILRRSVNNACNGGGTIDVHEALPF